MLLWELIFRPGGKEVIFRIFIIIHILNFLRNRGIIMAVDHHALAFSYRAKVCFVLAGKVNKMDEGTDRMQEIAASIREGARAFLSAEYKILVIFAAVLFILIVSFLACFYSTAICFVVGAIFPTLAGFFGMTVATNANVRTANAARTGGMNKALSIAFSGGAVMGMCVVGLGLLGVGAIYVLTGNADILFGFSLGASSIALFGRVGGGIWLSCCRRRWC